MSEKTEKPTPKKVRDARKKGQVAKSIEITGGLQLAAMLGYFLLEGPFLLQAFEILIDVSIEVVNQPIGPATDQIVAAFVGLTLRFLGGIAALVIAITVISILSQVGPLLASEALKPSLEKVNPLNNAKQMFSMQSLFELTKSIFKVLVLSLICYYLIRTYTPSIQHLPLCDVECGITTATRLLFWMLAVLLGFYAIFGLADFAFQRYNTTKKLMMSIEDIKQEFKNTEGNAEIKGKRKEIHREIQSGSLASNVKKSTMIVRNPKHIAVCLYYQKEETPLPQVLEIGYDQLALHIVKLGEKAGIPVVENIEIARTLAAQVPPGGYIPSTLFEPVAHLLRIVMDIKYEDDTSY
ncbi:EscU/YscU/HrcU family type III secretion system export apparatus switch protein [Pseudomonas chlororaphis]|uniref:EscU/YscU/HrcU family type III secretion system export apparatus switch protein n=1 Tax=Pseudomonas chlororaphis TaxID=587753 RepID=UPI0015DE18C8|nr:EscU/YscU/HrcU family type III secretion system export apparatus switch protein [Pseudomonas chlororaphis]QLL13481.1 EscU/YscU/HrcU family type III secretion system export apparatus switch protein [Pseudomonas chlororaphis subsp. aurantiaca]